MEFQFLSGKRGHASKQVTSINRAAAARENRGNFLRRKELATHFSKESSLYWVLDF